MYKNKSAEVKTEYPTTENCFTIIINANVLSNVTLHAIILF